MSTLRDQRKWKPAATLTKCIIKRMLSPVGDRGARRISALGFGVVLVALASLASTSCTVDSKAEITRQIGTRANAGDFRSAGVTTVFERHCGSLDCHGTNARNLRIYSSNGLRLPNEAGTVPGGGDTTGDEVTANYNSLVNLEPEQMNEVVINGADPMTLLILKKPIGPPLGEHHKGGSVITKGDDADTCIESWLKEDPTHAIDKNACAGAALFPGN